MASLTEIVRTAQRRAMTMPVILPGDCIEPPEPYHRFLYWLVHGLQPRHVLELGVKTGTGIGHMLAATDDVQVTGVDVDTRPEAGLIDWVKRSERVTLVEEESLTFLWDLIKSGGFQEFQLVHVDTVHESAYVDQEVDACRMLMKPPGLVCIDDIGLNADMRAWWRDLKTMDDCLDLAGLHVTGYGCVLFE